MFNMIIVMGNLTRDPEIKAVGTTSVAKFGIAANRQFKDKSGKVIQEVCFVDVETWGAIAENCGKYLKKGARALVEGRLKLDTWADKDGKERSKHLIYATSVTFLDKRTDNDQEEQEVTPRPQPKPDIQLYGIKTKAKVPAADIDDELPF